MSMIFDHSPLWQNAMKTLRKLAAWEDEDRDKEKEKARRKDKRASARSSSRIERPLSVKADSDSSLWLAAEEMA